MATDIPKDYNVARVRVDSGSDYVMVSVDYSGILEEYHVWGSHNRDGFSKSFKAADEADEEFAAQKKRLASVFKELTDRIMNGINN